jgi:hypothetical protein
MDHEDHRIEIFSLCVENAIKSCTHKCRAMLCLGNQADA